MSKKKSWFNRIGEEKKVDIQKIASEEIESSLLKLDLDMLSLSSIKIPDNPFKIKIKGNWETKEIFVDRIAVSITESLKHYHYADRFSWGDYSGETKQAALAILLSCESPYPGYAITMFKYFTGQILSQLPQEDFEIEYEL